jgi:hypothetical protein
VGEDAGDGFEQGGTTMTGRYDAIVVGARCAGSPTAMLLAQKGYRVLVVDRATFPSDTVSTHVIHAPGVAALRRWGLLDRVTGSGCPPVDVYSFDFGPFTIAGTPRPVDGSSSAFAPRRTILDTVLVDAAAAAGAEVRERFTVEEVVVEDAPPAQGGDALGVDEVGGHGVARERRPVDDQHPVSLAGQQHGGGGAGAAGADDDGVVLVLVGHAVTVRPCAV